MASDTIQDKTLLKDKISQVREMIEVYEEEIESIKEDEIMEILNSYEDIETYFSSMKEELEAQYNTLAKSTVKEEDSYWSDEF